LNASFSDVLRIRSFRDLWLGQAISQLGDAFYYVIFMFMVKKITDSDVMVGMVGAAETLPFLIFGPYSGVLADRMDRRRIMLLSDVVSGLTLLMFAGWLAGMGTPPVWMLLVVPFVLSSVRVFFLPAKSASIPSLVPHDKVLAANGLSMTTQSMMPLIGLAISAGAIAPLYESSPKTFYLVAALINATSFLGSAYFIARLPKIQPEPMALDRADDPRSDLRIGLEYLRSRHDLIVMTALLAVFRLMVSPFFVVYLAANKAWFGDKPRWLALFEFAFFLGMVVASPIVSRMDPKRPARWFCFGLAIIGGAVGAMAFSPYIWGFVLWNIVAGLAVPVADIPINTYLQLSVPDALRGRVNAVREMVATGVMPIGMSLAGLLVQSAGIVATFLVMGVGMVLACLGGLLDPRFRDVEMPKKEESVELDPVAI
jgi:MFS transporter, DHA3 family, macrolide efflux protein